MGTSSSYGGPRPTGDLLPPGAPDPIDPEETGNAGPEEPGAPGEVDGDSSEEQEQPGAEQPRPAKVAWGQAKSSLSTFAGASDRTSPKAVRAFDRARKGFVRSQGGAERAARSSPAGQAGGRALGKFLRDVSRLGARAALGGQGLGDLVGKNCRVLISALVDRLASSSGHSEEDVARRAMTSTLVYLFDEQADGSLSLDALDELGEEDARRAIKRFIAEHIFERFMHVFGLSVEKYAPNENEAAIIEREVHDLLVQRVEGVAMKIDVLAIDWSGEEATGTMDALFEEALSLVEAD